MANPRELRKYYMKVFQRDRELFKEFLAFYDQAVEEGSSIPEDLAWIRFREKYTETEEGWMEK